MNAAASFKWESSLAVCHRMVAMVFGTGKALGAISNIASEQMRGNDVGGEPQQLQRWRQAMASVWVKMPRVGRD